MAVDYDAPRKREGEPEVDSLEEVHEVSANRSKQQPNLEEDDAVAADSFELPGADLSGLELTVEVTPQQADEFTCTICFLVHHQAALASSPAGAAVCADCT